MRHRILPLLFLAVCGSPALGQDTSPAGSKGFGAWSGTCNNIGACVAIGPSEDDAFFYVRIARDAGASAAPQVKIVLALQDKLTGTSPAFTLTTTEKGKSTTLGPYPAKTDTDMTQYDTTLAPVEVSLGFIEALRNADTLDYGLLGRKGTLDLKGLSATLRWIDAQQGRAGTPTAMVARGMTPIGQVPEPREAPLVTGAAPDSAAQIDKPTISQAVLDAAKGTADCEEDTVKAHEGFEAWTFGPDAILFIVPCTNGAYNFGSALFFTDAKGNNPHAVILPQSPGAAGGMAPNILFNESFDPKTMVLSDFAKGRGIGDCGETTSWVWTGQEFALLEASSIEACPGALSEDWPNTYTARRR